MTPYYQDDLVTIYHGDCRDVLPSLPSVDLMVADPPYGLQARYGGITGVRRTIEGDADTGLLLWCAEASAVVRDGWIVLFCGWNANERVQRVAENSGARVHTVIVWDKGVATSGRGDLRGGPGIREQHEFMVLASRGRPARPWHGGNVWAFQRDMGDLMHPNQKPVTLMAATIDRLTMPGATVLDPCIGSGSTLTAAKLIGRRSIGIEIEERYCEIAANRCRQEVLGLSA